MALLKAFMCQVVLVGLYKLFLEQVFEDYLVPDELTRNCVVGFVCLLCFGIQLYTEKVEEQKKEAESAKSKSRRWSPPDTAETVSEFLDARTANMMRTLDAAMQQMNQMPMSDGYVQNVVFAAAGPEATVIEQTFVKHPDVVLVEEIHMTKLSDVRPASEPIPIPVKVEEIREVKRNEKEEEEVEEESETKSDVCEEEEEDVVTVIDASKPVQEVKKTKPESEEEEEEEEEEEPIVVNIKKSEKIEEKPVKDTSKKVVVVEEEEEEDEEEEEEEEEEEPVVNVKKNFGKPAIVPSKEVEEEEEEEEEESDEEPEKSKDAGKESKKS